MAAAPGDGEDEDTDDEGVDGEAVEESRDLLGITADQALYNYNRAGTLVPEHRVLIETYGFKCRESLDGKRCNYRTPPPRSRWLDRKQSVVLYLKAEHAQGRMLDLKAEMFCFGKRKAEGDQTGRESTSVGMGTTELVTKDPGVVLDHRHILSTTAKRLDSFITGRGQPASSECVEGAKERVAGAVDDKSLLSALMSDSKLVDCLAGEILELHVSEIAGIRGGPLTQFPPDVNRNLYADIVEWAMQEIPGSLAHVAGLATRRDRPVLPRDVVVIASALANSAYLVNHHISAVIQLRSWTSQAEVRAGGQGDMLPGGDSVWPP